MINAILKRYENGFTVTPENVQKLHASIKRAQELTEEGRDKTEASVKSDVQLFSEIFCKRFSKPSNSLSEAKRIADQTGIFSELPSATQSILRGYGIYSLNDLSRCTRKRLIEIGVKNPEAIDRFLRARGFNLAEK